MRTRRAAATVSDTATPTTPRASARRRSAWTEKGGPRRSPGPLASGATARAAPRRRSVREAHLGFRTVVDRPHPGHVGVALVVERDRLEVAELAVGFTAGAFGA